MNNSMKFCMACDEITQHRWNGTRWVCGECLSVYHPTPDEILKTVKEVLDGIRKEKKNGKN